MSASAASDKCATDTGEKALDGVRVCLVFEYRLSHYTRLLDEIKILQGAGASVTLLTSWALPDSMPPGVTRVVTGRPYLESHPETSRSNSLGLSTASRTVRRLQNVCVRLQNWMARARALRAIARDIDMFWVVDYPSLPAVLRAASRSDVSVVYETVDLVPEYKYRGEMYHRFALARERRLVTRVQGFITACDEYADYYIERYAAHGLIRRPFVRDNMPKTVASAIKPTSSHLQALFLGSLMFDRPVLELIRAIANTGENIDLTFQGENYLQGEPSNLITDLGLGDRVRILNPCLPEEIVSTAHEYDIGIVALRGQDENERRASTSKLFTYMASGLAIVGSNLPGIARVIREAHNGIMVQEASSESWTSGFDAIAAMTSGEIDDMKRASLRYAAGRTIEEQTPGFVAEFVRALDRAAS